MNGLTRLVQPRDATRVHKGLQVVRQDAVDELNEEFPSVLRAGLLDLHVGR